MTTTEKDQLFAIVWFGGLFLLGVIVVVVEIAADHCQTQLAQRGHDRSCEESAGAEPSQDSDRALRVWFWDRITNPVWRLRP